MIHIASDRYAEKQTPRGSLTRWTFDGRPHARESRRFSSILIYKTYTAPRTAATKFIHALGRLCIYNILHFDLVIRTVLCTRTCAPTRVIFTFKPPRWMYGVITPNQTNKNIPVTWAVLPQPEVGIRVVVSSLYRHRLSNTSYRAATRRSERRGSHDSHLTARRRRHGVYARFSFRPSRAR